MCKFLAIRNNKFRKIWVSITYWYFIFWNKCTRHAVYRYQQVICSAVPQRMGNWCINLSCWKIPIARGLRCRDKQQCGFPGSAKGVGKVCWCTVESIFICLGKVWQQQHYLSRRAQRVKRWLSGRQWVTRCKHCTGLKQGWQKLGADWKVRESSSLFQLPHLWPNYHRGVSQNLKSDSNTEIHQRPNQHLHFKRPVVQLVIRSLNLCCGDTNRKTV